MRIILHLLYKGLEYPQILVSAEGPGTNPPWDWIPEAPSSTQQRPAAGSFLWQHIRDFLRGDTAPQIAFLSIVKGRFMEKF